MKDQIEEYGIVILKDQDGWYLITRDGYPFATTYRTQQQAKDAALRFIEDYQ